MPFDGPFASKFTFAEIDRNTTLCLACSSSLPPLKALSPSTPSSSRGDTNSNGIHITKCCHRPICPSCVTSNRRLARYDPCLACLGGVGAVASQTTTPLTKSTFLKVETPSTPDRNFNLDGAVRDEDTFVLGDDDDDEPDEHSPNDRSVDLNPPPPYDTAIPPNNNPITFPTAEPSARMRDPEQTHQSLVPSKDLEGTSLLKFPLHSGSLNDLDATEAPTGPCKYYLKRSDTLMGICLRFGVDCHEICKLNSLPTSIMRTTPHLLHTRAFLLLPVTPKTLQYTSSQSNDAEKERIKRREEILVRERAERRVQTLMKEVDWRVAKAYVALADDADEQEAHHFKLKEMGTPMHLGRPVASGKSRSSDITSELEVLAVERYLDDDEWETEERRAGRRPEAISFTLGKGHNQVNVATSSGKSRRMNEKRQWW